MAGARALLANLAAMDADLKTLPTSGTPEASEKFTVTFFSDIFSSNPYNQNRLWEIFTSLYVAAPATALRKENPNDSLRPRDPKQLGDNIHIDPFDEERLNRIATIFHFTTNCLSMKKLFSICERVIELIECKSQKTVWF